MAQQTAVEWLQEMYNQGDGYERHLTESEFEQAKQMEKKQIIKAFNDLNDDINAEQYYNENYNKL